MAIPQDVQNLDVEEALGEEAGLESIFVSWSSTHGKKYDSADEYNKRKTIFAQNSLFVQKWNSNPDSKFRVATNEFADLTNEEFAAQFLANHGLEEENQDEKLLDRSNFLLDESSQRQVGESLRSGALHVNSGRQLPKAKDWASKGRTGSVYKQGVCAACYTFATNAAIEGQYYIATGKKMPELSDQEILSCSRDFGNHGCIGGNMEKSYHYIMNAQEKRGGMSLASDYPYEGSETPCKRNKYSAVNVKLAGYRKVARGSEADLKDAVAQHPVAVGIDAHHPAFKLYSSGVFDIDYCTTHLTHAVLVVGYGTTEDGKDYWKLQNSWGKAWGTEGFGKIARGKNMCAISNLASYPVIEKPETWRFES
jgi:cathepsin L